MRLVLICANTQKQKACNFSKLTEMTYVVHFNNKIGFDIKWIFIHVTFNIERNYKCATNNFCRLC